MSSSYGRTCRHLAGALILATLTACSTSRVDGVTVTWPPFKDGSLLTLPSDPAQCPDLTGRYRTQGERRAGGPQGVPLKDLREFFAFPLALPGMESVTAPAWQSSAEATIRFTPDKGGWALLAQDGQGAQIQGSLVMHEDGQPADQRPMARDLIQRSAGCTQGRLWISVRQDWRQHESMGVRRHVAILRKEDNGLLLTVQRESDSIGMLLPWYTNDSVNFQYWFAPAADHQ